MGTKDSFPPSFSGLCYIPEKLGGKELGSPLRGKITGRATVRVLPMKSGNRNRQPIWSLSSVVLLSALLLSPVTAATLLQAVLSQQLSQNALPSTAAGSRNLPARGETSPVSVATPRRVGDEEDLLRRAATLADHALSDRHDIDPDPIARESAAPSSTSHYYRTLAHALLLALLVPKHGEAPALPDALIADSGLRRSFTDESLPARCALRSASPPRAPPLV